MSVDPDPKHQEVFEPTTAENRPVQQATPATTGSLRFRLGNGESPITNFSGDASETWKFTGKVTGAGTLKGGDMIGKLIDLKYWYVHNIEMVSQKTGEVTDCMRAVLVDQSGNAYGFVSSGIIDGLDVLRSVYGDGPYHGQARLTVAQVNTRGGNRTYNIVPFE